MPVPVPSQVTNPTVGSLETLEIATPSVTPTFQQVSLSDNITFTPNNDTEKFQPFDADGSNFNVKTGYDYTLNITTAAHDSDAAMALLMAAGAAVGDSAILMFRIKHGDGSYHSGNFVVGAPSYPDAHRNVRKIEFACTTTGSVTYTSAANAA